MALGGSAGTAYVDLVPRLDPSFNKQLSDAVDGATQPALARFSDAFKSAGASMMAAGTKMSLGITLPLGLAGVAAFNLASDLQESMSKVGVVFAESAGDILDWSKTSAGAFGMSRQEALEAAGTYGNLFRAMGIGTPVAADMSKTMVQLAGDLASFNNANPTEVLDALRAGLVGETEPLRRFGVNINQARLEAKALEMGLWDGEEAISASAKAQAAYALILEDTALAQGDYARTADGAANRQRTLTANLKNLGATIGTILLPIGTKLLEWAQKLVGYWEQFSSGAQKIIVLIGAIAAVMGPVVFALGALSTAIGVLLSPIGLIIVALAALAVAAYFVYKNWDSVWPRVKAVALEVWTWLQEHAGWLVDAIRGVVAGVLWLKENWRLVWDGIKAKAAEVWAWMQANVVPTFALIGQAIQVAMDRIQDVIRIAVDVITFIWQHFGDRILEAVRITWEYIKGSIEVALELIRGIVQIFIGIFTLDWDTFWQGVQTILSAVWDALKLIVQTGIDTLLNIFGVAKDLLGIAWDALWSLIKEATSAAWDGIKSLVQSGIDNVISAVAGLPGALLGFVGDMASAGAQLGGALIDALGNAISGASGIAGDIADGMVRIVKGAWNAFANKVNDSIPNEIPIPFLPDIDLPDNPIPRLHSGGIVPGELGQEVLILAKAGERVLTAEQDRRRARSDGPGAGVTIGNVTLPQVRDAYGFVRMMRRIERERA